MKEFETYLRVTDVLFPFSGLGQIDSLILQRAAERGTKVHAICDAIIQGIGYPEPEESILGYVESYLCWNQDKNWFPKPDRFFCDTLGITGECDAVYRENGNMVLVDFKTSSQESKTWKLQGSAYAYLARKNGYTIDRIEFVKLEKGGKPAKVFVYEEDFEMFLKCLEIYKYFFKGKVKHGSDDTI
jgi:hypothetical protein